jgi:hypothetical protein
VRELLRIGRHGGPKKSQLTLSASQIPSTGRSPALELDSNGIAPFQELEAVNEETFELPTEVAEEPS